MKMVDAADWMVVLGVTLLGAALYLWLGLAALLGYLGALLVAAGLAVAMRGKQAKRHG